MRPREGATERPPLAVRVVGIAGPSGCGKTTLAHAVAQHAGGIVLGLDAYYRDQRDVEDARLQVDVPEAIDVGLAGLHLQALLLGNGIEQPVYDFARHARRDETRRVEPSPLVVVEGLFALYWTELRELMRTRVFVTLDHDECLRRRIERDMRERGRSAVEVTAQYEEQVRPMYDRHVAPTRHHAHIVLDGRARVDQLARQILGALGEN
jgi:uridine kinase